MAVLKELSNALAETVEFAGKGVVRVEGQRTHGRQRLRVGLRRLGRDAPTTFLSETTTSRSAWPTTTRRRRNWSGETRRPIWP